MGAEMGLGVKLQLSIELLLEMFVDESAHLHPCFGKASPDHARTNGTEAPAGVCCEEGGEAESYERSSGLAWKGVYIYR